jgi:ABC-type uncharacterized transport system ATPase component
MSILQHLIQHWQKVLSLTDKLVKENRLTTLMVTHNMKMQFNMETDHHDGRGRIIADIPLEKRKISKWKI